MSHWQTRSTWHVLPVAAAGGASRPPAPRRGLWVGGGCSGASVTADRNGTLHTGLSAELGAVSPHWGAWTAEGEMAHGDLMSQAEDVADQVSSSARGTRTLRRPQTGWHSGRHTDVRMSSAFTFTVVQFFTRYMFLVNQCFLQLNSADRSLTQTTLCSHKGKLFWTFCKAADFIIV